ASCPRDPAQGVQGRRARRQADDQEGGGEEDHRQEGTREEGTREARPRPEGAGQARPGAQERGHAYAARLSSVRDPVGIATGVGAQAAPHAARHDREGTFVSEGYTAIRASGLPLLCVPSELGGWGCGLGDAVAVHTELARHCASTSLAFAMHTHAVATY